MPVQREKMGEEIAILLCDFVMSWISKKKKKLRASRRGRSQIVEIIRDATLVLTANSSLGDATRFWETRKIIRHKRAKFYRNKNH